MTASEQYYTGIEKGLLPGVVPIQELGSNRVGLATESYQVEGNKRAEKMALSEDWRTRGLAAVMACHQVRRSVERQHETLRVG